MSTSAANTVAVFIDVTDGDQPHLILTLQDLQRQRDVAVSVVVLDRTTEGIAHIDGVSIVNLGPEASLGEGYRAALRHTEAELIAWQTPGVRSLPNRLVAQSAQILAHPEWDLVTTNLVLIDSRHRLVAMADPRRSLDAPTPFWQSSVMLRRDALTRIGRSSDLPVELFLYLKLLREGRAGHMAVALTVVSEARFEAVRDQSLRDAAAVARIQPPIVSPSADRWAQVRGDLDERIQSSETVSNEIARAVLHEEGTEAPG